MLKGKDESEAPKDKPEELPQAHTLKKAVNEGEIAAAKVPTGRPTIDILLDPIKDESTVQEDRSDLLEKTLKSFNVDVTISGYICGPTITRYEVIPERG